MINNNETSISKISKSSVKIIRFITSIFSYLFILACSGMVVYFANKRGNPVELKVLYYIALVLNIGQILLVISKFVIQQVGIFDRVLYKIENILAIVWEVVIVAQFVLASILFSAFRLDSLIIALVQGLAILMMLLYSRKIDYAINKKHNQKVQKTGDISLHSASALKKRDITKNFLYVFVCGLIFVLELIVLTIPKLPPRIDDIFSENRVLQYAYAKDVKGYKDGYYVKTVYYGTNDKIVIPLTYNGEPVVGILKNAITDEGIINTIQIGEYNDKGVLVSNVSVIESNGITLNRIKEINLPSSIETLGTNAISGKEITSINVYGDVALNSKSFDTENLAELNLKNTENVVEADFENLDVEVNVPTNLYNKYRERFFESRKLFDIFDDDKYIVVDFETNSDVYLNSKFLDKKDAKLNITSLKNEGEETSTLIKDTVLYNEDKYNCDGFQSKNGYALRGWYRDENYSLECKFTDTQDIYFNDDTTIYARWEEIKTVELDWVNYYPNHEKVTIINFVATDDINASKDFPKIKAEGGTLERFGFTSLKWVDETTDYDRTYDLRNSDQRVIHLTAQWELESPEVSYETIVDNISYTGSNYTFTFDEAQIINYMSTFSHISDEVSITCVWKKQNADSSFDVIKTFSTGNADSFNYKLRNVADSGLYELEVIATALTGETKSVKQAYTINISKKKIDISSYGIMAPVTKVYNGESQELIYDYPLPPNIKVSETYDLDGTYSSIVGPTNARSEAYSVRYTFENINEERDNYDIAYSYSSIKIEPKPVTAIWTQQDVIWNEAFEVVYDGAAHNLVPTVDGVCGKDVVSFKLRNSSEKNAGAYNSQIIGVNNTNYIVDEANTVMTHEWRIVPKKVSTTWYSTEAQYTGSNIGFDLSLEGIVSGDLKSITSSDFSSVGGDTVVFNSSSSKLTFYVKNTGEYNILVESFVNSNYDFEPVSQTVEVTKVALSASWSNGNTTYNGNEQSVKLTISGFKANDEKKYTDDVLNNYMILFADCDYRVSNQQGGKLEIEFFAKDAGVYSTKIEKITDNENYTILSSSNQLVISSKALTGLWLNTATTLTYNGVNQSRKYRISGLHKDDIENMSKDDFAVEFNGLDYELEKNLSSNYVDIVFYGKDAKTYNISINSFDSAKFSSNLTLSKVTHNFRIEPKLLNVDWESSSYTYNDKEQVIKVKNIKNLCGNDTTELIYENNKATNAGTYIASITSANTNYITNSTCNKEWKIERKNLTVTIDTVDSDNHKIAKATYDGKYKYFKVIYSGFEGDDLLTVSSGNLKYSFNNSFIFSHESVTEGNSFVSKFKAINANDYTVTLNSHTLSNYNITTTKSTFSIDQLAATMTWDYVAPFTYSKTAHSVNASVSNLCTREDTGLTDTVTTTLSNNSKTNAGDYTATVTYLSNSNYSIDEATSSLDWEIEKCTLVISWNNPNLVFNAYHQSKTATGTNIYANDSVTFSYSWATMNASTGIYSSYSNSTDTINKGNYRVKISGLSGSSASNYQLPTTGIESSYEITPLKLSVSIVSNDRTYNGSEQGLFTVKFSGFPTSTESSNFALSNVDYQQSADQMVKNSSSYSECSFDVLAKDAGTYSVTVLKCKNNSNYIFDEATLSASLKPRVVNLSWNTSTYTYDGTAKNFTATITNLVSGDNVGLTYAYSGSSYLGNVIKSNTMTDAGAYKLEVKALDNSNYTLTGASNLSQDYVIKRRSVQVSTSGTSYTYNGGYQGLSLTVTGYVDKDKALFNNNPLVYSHNGAKYEYDATNKVLKLSSINAGTYNVSVTGLTSSFANSNYELASTVSTQYTISKKTISINWSTTSLTYNGVTQSVIPTIDSSSICNNDKLALNYSGNSAINAGSYTAKVDSLTGESSSNYQLPSTTTKSWSIAKKALTLTWSSANNFTYDGKYHSLTLTVSGFQNNDAYNTTKGNFTVPSTSLAISELKASSSGSVQLSFSIIDAGSHTCKISSFSNTNYTFASTSQTLMVNQKEVTVMWDYSTPFTYNGQTQSINCIVTNACIRDDKSTVDNVQVVLSNNSKTNAGTYTAEATSLSNSNYKLPSTKPSKTWTIEKATLTGAWESINDFVYDGNTHYATLVISGFVNSSDASGMNTGSFTTNKIYSISTDSENRVLLKFSLKDVNTYSFTVSDVNSQNYNLNTVKTKDVKVAKRNVVVKIVENSEYTYSGLSQGKEMHLSNITSADISSFSNYLIVTGNAFYNYNTNSDGIIYYFSGVNAGDYNARITSKSTLLNYKFDTEYIAFTITPKKLEKKWSTSTGNWTDVYDGNNKTITLRIEGFVNAEKYSTNNFTVSRAATSDNSVAGVLTITFTAKDSGSYVCSVSNFNNSNYKFDDDSKTYEIKPRELEVLWSGSSSTYDGSYQGYTLKVEGFVSSDATSVKNSLLYSGNITPTVSSTSKAITYSFQATNTGTYNVKVYANSTLKNYTLTELNESFTISKRNITVDINSLSEGRVVFTNLVAGQSISSYSLKVYSDSARKNSVTDWSKDGVYYYSLAIIGADNYNLTNSNGSFEVGEL